MRQIPEGFIANLRSKYTKFVTKGVMMCGLGALFYFYQYIIKLAPAQCADEIIRTYNVDGAFNGYFSSMFLLGYALAQLPVGMIYQAYGPRFGLMLGCNGVVLTSLAQGYVTSPAALLMTRFFAGSVCAFALLGCLVLAEQWFPKSYSGRATSAVVSFGIVGGMLSEQIVAALVHRYHWSIGEMFVMFAVIGLIIFGLIAYFLEAHGPYYISQDEENGAVYSPELLSSAMLATSIYACTSYWPLDVIGNTFAPKFASDLGLTSAISPQFAILAGMMIGLFYSGHLVDKYGYTDVLVPAGLINGLLVMSLSILPFVLIAPAFFIIGLISSTSVLPIAFANFLAPQATSTARAIVNCAQMIGASFSCAASALLLRTIGATKGGSTAGTGSVVMYTSSTYAYLWFVMGTLMITATFLFWIAVPKTSSGHKN
jgi:MFS family permease